MNENMTEKPLACAPGVYALINSTVNVFMLDDSESGVTVIDAGMPGTTRRVLELVQKIGRSPQDVRHILITHADTDHVSGLKSLVEATGAAVYASPEANQYIQRRCSPPHLRMPFRAFAGVLNLLLRRAVPVEHLVSDGEMLDMVGGIRAITTPGHTPDHVCYYWERERVLFAGDLLNNRAGLRLTPTALTWDMAAARQSVRKVLALEPAVICTGHGQVWRASEDPDRIRMLLVSLEEPTA
jgi:glyoxylase-like metal-dependent hydrolase (beta-lactamase superfamily II)